MHQETKFSPEAEMEKRLRAELFPSDKFPAKFHEYKEKVMEAASRRSLECSFLTFLSLSSKQDGDPYDMYEISFLLNGFETTARKDFGLSKDEYINLMSNIEALTVLWNELAKPHKEAVGRQLQALQERKIIPASNGSTMTGNRNQRRK